MVVSMNSTVFWVVTPWSSDKTPTLRRNFHPFTAKEAKKQYKEAKGGSVLWVSIRP